MQLFYAPDITLPQYTLDEEESKHAIRVLRLARGDAMHLTDGRGNLYHAEVLNPDPKKCTIRITGTEEEYEKLPYNLIMAVAPTKNTDRFEWFLEKATEVGTARFIPIECEHSERRTARHDRMDKVITSAMKQSLKAYRPILDELTPFEDVVTRQLVLPDGRPFAGRKLIAHCHEGEHRFIGKCFGGGEDVLVLIGPEGDFSQSEIDLALSRGFTAVSLGNSRLRTETAALAAVMNVSFVNSHG